MSLSASSRTFVSRLRTIFFPQDGRVPLPAFIRKHIVPVLVIFVITLILEHFGRLRTPEMHGLDAMLNLHTPPESANIVLVTIDNEDYQQIFQSTSPLDPSALQNAIRQIERGKPAVIAVDLETDSPQFGSLEWPEAVWVRNALPGSEHGSDALEERFTPEALSNIRRGSFLGGRGRELPHASDEIILTEPPSGASLFLADADGLIRRFRSVYFSSESDPPSEVGGYVESFAWTISRQYARYLKEHGEENSIVARRIDEEEHRNLEERAEEVILSFGGSRDRFRRIALRHVLQGAEQSYWEENSPLKDAIVILGGTYAASRDVYITPVGPRYGIELVAHTVETTLANGGIREFNHHLAHAADIVVGLLILVVLWRFPGHRAFIATLLVAAALALLASFVAYRSFAYWFNFAPMVGGLWLHFQWEKRKEHRELRHEVQRLRSEIEDIQKSRERPTST